MFGGGGANRTVTVTPAPNRSGTATITVRVTDASGVPATASFVLTVKAAVTFKFKNVQNAPPPSGTTFKAGSTVPMKWTYQERLDACRSADVGTP